METKPGAPGGIGARPGRGPRLVAAAVLALAAAALAPLALAAQEPAPSAEEMVEVVRAVESVDAMRSSLARTVSEGGTAADRETFRRVCAPVGQRARSVAGEHGWTFEQLSRKFRNPAHRPDAEAGAVLARMADDPDLSAIWRRSEREGRPGWRYFRRIVVEPACLACHGLEAERPSFVKESYPEDRAFGFRPGDLRGLYSVFVPDDSVGEGGR